MKRFILAIALILALSVSAWNTTEAQSVTISRPRLIVQTFCISSIVLDFPNHEPIPGIAGYILDTPPVVWGHYDQAAGKATPLGMETLDYQDGMIAAVDMEDVLLPGMDWIEIAKIRAPVNAPCIERDDITVLAMDDDEGGIIEPW